MILWSEQYASKSSFDYFDERDIESLASSESNVVLFDKDDEIARIYMYFFKSLEFQYGSMGGKPTNYNYMKCKDRIKWSGLKAKDFIPLLDGMFNSFVGGLK